MAAPTRIPSAARSSLGSSAAATRIPSNDSQSKSNTSGQSIKSYPSERSHWSQIFNDHTSISNDERSEYILGKSEQARQKLQDKVLKEESRSKWTCLRRRTSNVLNSHGFEIGCACVILFNMVVVVIETDYVGEDVDLPWWIDVCTYGCLGFYTLELICKLYVDRSEFFNETWNVIDFIIVGIDLVSIVLELLLGELPAFTIIRIFRLLRVVRAFKAAKLSRSLQVLLRSCAHAIKAIFWGMVMMMMVLLVWGILAVHLIHPINQRVADKGMYEGCERCPRAFASVFDSMLTFWKQLVAGDSWGILCEPIIDEDRWTSLFFMLVLVTVSLTMLNCILAVVVEAGAAAAAADDHEMAVEHEGVSLQAEENLISLCHEIDSNGDGALSYEEFRNAFADNENVRHCLELMHATEADLLMIFNICDEDSSGRIDYREFVEQVRRIKHSPDQLILHYVTDIRNLLMRIKPEFLELEALMRQTSRGSSGSKTSSKSTSSELSNPGEQAVKIEIGDADKQAVKTEIVEQISRLAL